MLSHDPAVPLTAQTGSAYIEKGSVQEFEVAAQFESLVRDHHASIFRVAFRLTGHRDEAEDLVQEALVEAYESFARYRPGTHFDRWLYRIMRNTFLDAKRRHGRASVHSLDARDEQTGLSLASLAATLHSADTELMSRTLDGPIQEALDALPPDFRLVVVLADIEGLSYEEVSEVVGRPIGTVRSRLHRARLTLKDTLKDYVRS